MGVAALSAELSATHVLHVRAGVSLLVHRDWQDSLDVEALLRGVPVAAWGTPVAHDLKGRAAVHVLATARGELVAKRIERGGLLAFLARRWFVDAARPLREAAVAEAYRRRGGRTPVVVVARSRRGAFGLHALELATARWPAQGDLAEVLAVARNEPRAAVLLARAAGRTLRQMHDLGLQHRDLQVRNLLVPRGFPGPGGAHDPEPFVVLDLDRCRIGQPLEARERRRQMARLFRSLAKQGLLPVPRGSAAAFTRGYAGAGDPRRVSPELGSTGRLVRRAVASARAAVAWRGGFRS